MTATLPPGSYQVRCDYPGEIILDSATVAVTGAPVDDAHPYLPATQDEMDTAVGAYRLDVRSGLDQLAVDTDTLQADVDRGDLTAARRQWLVAHLDYERLGAAYDTFGQFDEAIDGRPDGLPGGVGDPNWTGFLRLEYGLWNGQSVAVLTPVADQLDREVHALVQAFPDPVSYTHLEAGPQLPDGLGHLGLGCLHHGDGHLAGADVAVLGELGQDGGVGDATEVGPGAQPGVQLVAGQGDAAPGQEPGDDADGQQLRGAEAGRLSLIHI